MFLVVKKQYMIKLVIFDLDGVLVSSKEAHYLALNKAISKIAPGYEISRDDQVSIYDGLPTREKLRKLSKKGLSISKHKEIHTLKQSFTADEISRVKENHKLKTLFKNLRDRGIKIAIASNAITNTTNLYLISLGIHHLCDYIISNQMVFECKPNPEMYLRAMIEFSASPNETLIVEDSAIGVKAAILSKANIYTVKSTNDVFDIPEFLTKIKSKSQLGWQSQTLNIVIPMAGGGRRFSEAGHTLPKPFIPVDGKPMIQRVVENLNIKAKYIFLVRKEHYHQYIDYILKLITENSEIIIVDKLTDGAACTVLLAEKLINNNDQLIIANSDQLISYDSIDFMYSMISRKADGGLLTFSASNAKWIYVKCDEHDIISEVAEKKVISKIATCGIYFWKHGKDFVKYAKQMIDSDIRTNNEFYVAPVYNEAIKDSKRILSYPVSEMFGLGTPEDLKKYLNRKK